MKGRARKHTLALVSVMSISFAGTATAGLPVFDMVNFASNVAQNVQLTMIKKTLVNHESGSINYYTNNIDKSTRHVDRQTWNIDQSTKEITKINSKIEHNIAINTEINQKFKWIIKKGGGEEIIPIPREVEPMLRAILRNGSSEDYAANFRDAAYYSKSGTDNLATSGLEGSRARKAANDALVKTIDMEQARLDEEAGGLKELAEIGNKVEGHGHQLQVANALAGSQANQMIKIRSLMLVAEASRAAEAQATADKDARAIAASKRLRKGLEQMVSQTSNPLPNF